MKIITKTQTVALSVGLTKEEVVILTSAQSIVNELWDKFEDVDTLDSTAKTIYHNIDEIGTCLADIASLVDIED